MDNIYIAMTVMFVVIIALFILSGARFIHPNERALIFVVGQYKGLVRSGFILVIPIITKVVKIDLSDHNWSRKLWEVRDKYSMDSLLFRELEKDLEKEAAEFRKAHSVLAKTGFVR